MKITILITTFKREVSLNVILRQLDDFYKDYDKKNDYQILICNSDSNTSAIDFKKTLHSQIKMPFRVITNQGEGFDDNLVNGFSNLEGDYVFLMADDDIFLENPFFSIDWSFGFIKKDCYLFNHVNASNGELYYKNKIRSLNLRIHLPRYCGLMYSIKFLKNLPLEKFNHTLHLYAIPFVIAALKNRVKLITTPLVIFSDPEKNDGAWVDKQAILLGLEKFLKNCKNFVSRDDFLALSHYFYENYLSKNSPVFRNESNNISYFKSWNHLFQSLNDD